MTDPRGVSRTSTPRLSFLSKRKCPLTETRPHSGGWSVSGAGGCCSDVEISARIPSFQRSRYTCQVPSPSRISTPRVTNRVGTSRPWRRGLSVIDRHVGQHGGPSVEGLVPLGQARVAGAPGQGCEAEIQVRKRHADGEVADGIGTGGQRL